MHCDDKRTLFVLKNEIEEAWEQLKESDFENQELVKKLNEMIVEYFDYKKSLN